MQGSEGEALLYAIKPVITCYTQEFPKSKDWKAQLDRINEAQAKMTDL